MKDGTKRTKGSRIVISISFPIEIFNRMQWLVERYGFNRSDFISKAVKFYLDSLGIKEGD
jgi:metal-responsive CopG/Arc/MetJ family transcriptional regulator